MKFKSIIFIGSLLTAAFSSHGQSPAVTDTKTQLMLNLQGVWNLSKIYDGKAEVALTKYPSAANQITFKENAEYVAKRGQQKSDSGLYRTNEDHMFLYFDSVNGKATSEWKATVQDSILTMSPKVEKGKRLVQYVYTKTPGNKNPILKK